MSNPTTIEVLGTPAPQGSKKAFTNPKTGRPIIVDDNPKTLRTWRNDVSQACAEQMVHLDEPVSVAILFRFALPASDQHRSVHTVKPDIDKLIRSTLDAMVAAGLIRDDAQVFSVSASKSYARNEQAPGATITVTPYGEEVDRLRAESKAAARLSIG